MNDFYFTKEVLNEYKINKEVITVSELSNAFTLFEANSLSVDVIIMHSLYLEEYKYLIDFGNIWGAKLIVTDTILRNTIFLVCCKDSRKIVLKIIFV